MEVEDFEGHDGSQSVLIQAQELVYGGRRIDIDLTRTKR
jgi:hypothetical protein